MYVEFPSTSAARQQKNALWPAPRRDPAPGDKAIQSAAGQRPVQSAGERCQACPMRALSLCGALEAGDLPEFAAAVTRVSYASKEPILEQGGDNDSVHIVSSGTVRLHRDLPDGRRLVLGFALPGDFLGLSTGDSLDLSADALGPVSTCKVSRAAFEALAESKPALMRGLYAEAAEELRLARDQMVLLGRRSARERVAGFILGLRDRWRRLNGRTALVDLPMTRNDIGDCLGLTVETVSRMFSALAREKIILIVPDGARILDEGRLEAAARS
jgi:CRP/FNR family transcriptional regulator